jgi:L-ascorbate metabolism protein UlaG (beta-lactamase superfamily)
MIISKYLHSCLLVEENNKVVLIDPGVFSYQEKVLVPKMLTALDYILVTHNHFDHMSTPMIKDFVSKFPDVTIISNEEVVNELVKEGLKASTKGDENITIIPLSHEKMFGGQKMSENSLFDIFGKLTHPGDSLSLDHTKDILALPLDAPWGSTTWALEVALKLKPKIVIPIHDYLWKDAIRKMFSERIAEYLKEKNIDFKLLDTGQKIEV